VNRALIFNRSTSIELFIFKYDATFEHFGVLNMMLNADIAYDVQYNYHLKNYTLIILNVFSLTFLISMIGMDHHQFQSSRNSKYTIDFPIAIKQYIRLGST
jgi:hypothetical protein